MRSRTRLPATRLAPGFSIIEIVVVVGIIAVLAAVALPNIVGFVRQSRVRGAMQQVAGDIQSARSKAIVRNTNQGVAFQIMDADTYRFFMADEAAGANLGPLRTLPAGVTFDPGTEKGIGFDRLGRACSYGAGCPIPSPVPPAVMCPLTDFNQCTNYNASVSYVANVGGAWVITVRDNNTQLTRQVSIAPGGRIVTQR